MSVFKYRSTWKVEVWTENKKIRTKSGFRTKSLAEKWKIEILGQLALDATSTSASFPKHTFNDLVKRYKEIHLPNIRIETARRYLIDIDKKISPFFNHYNLSQISAYMIEEFRANLIKQNKLAPKTINNCTDLLRSILNKAVRWGWLERSPFRLERLKIAYKTYNWWDDRSHIRAFLKTIKGNRYEIAYRLAVDFGLRLGEIVGLSKQDISWDLGVLHIHRQWIEKQRCYGPPKHNKARYLKFDPQSYFGICLKQAVENSIDPEAILTTKNGPRVLNRKLGGDLFHQKRREANIPRIRFHDLRHTFASWFMIQNGDIWRLMQILGHSSITTTMRYSHHSGKNQQAPNLDWGKDSPSEHPLSIHSHRER